MGPWGIQRESKRESVWCKIANVLVRIKFTHSLTAFNAHIHAMLLSSSDYTRAHSFWLKDQATIHTYIEEGKEKNDKLFHWSLFDRWTLREIVRECMCLSVHLYVCVWLNRCMCDGAASEWERESEKAGCWWLLIVVVSCVCYSGGPTLPLEFGVPTRLCASTWNTGKFTLPRIRTHMATRLPRFFHEFISSSTDHTHTRVQTVAISLPPVESTKFVLCRSFSILRFRQ